MTDPPRVVALIAAFNEEDVISAVIGHLVDNGVGAYLIDNRSTDATVEEARQWLGHGLIGIETFPSEPSAGRDRFEWTSLLRRKEELACEIEAGWFIHHDADEIRQGPWRGLNLAESIAWVDDLGYNAISFRVLDFPPIDNSFRRGMDPRQHFRFYREGDALDRVQVKAWKAGVEPLSLAATGGHDVRFRGRRVFPIPFLLRHYPIRSQPHGEGKVWEERKGRFLEDERRKGWHRQYDWIGEKQDTFLHDPAFLKLFDLDAMRLELMIHNRQLLRLNRDLKRARTVAGKFRHELLKARAAASAAEGYARALKERIEQLERADRESGPGRDASGPHPEDGQSAVGLWRTRGGKRNGTLGAEMRQRGWRGMLSRLSVALRWR